MRQMRNDKTLDEEKNMLRYAQVSAELDVLWFQIILGLYLHTSP